MQIVWRWCQVQRWVSHQCPSGQLQDPQQSSLVRLKSTFINRYYTPDMITCIEHHEKDEIVVHILRACFTAIESATAVAVGLGVCVVQ